MIMKKLWAMKNKKGFTLIELIIVIAILAILAAIAIPAMAGYIDSSKQAVSDANARTLYGAAAAAAATETLVSGDSSLAAQTYATLTAGSAYAKKIAQLLGEDYFKPVTSVTITTVVADKSVTSASCVVEGKTGTYPKP